VSTIIGTLVYLVFWKGFPETHDTESFVPVKQLVRAMSTKLKFLVFCHKESVLPLKSNSDSSLATDTASAEKLEDPQSAENTQLSGSEGSPILSDNEDGIYGRHRMTQLKETLAVCKMFLPLPVYWLIANQFGTNVVEQANSLDLPPSVPPEVLNNVNTISLLLSIVVLDALIIPRYFKHTPPSVCGRIVVGFSVNVAAMLWCGAVQVVVDRRGSYDANGRYSTYAGEAKLSFAWLIVPYVLQGAASSLIDTTVLESAYVLSPKKMKSTVMALYLLASSASGFLGILFAPLSAPQTIGIMFFVLGLLQAVVTWIFARLMRN
jgi:hypothetical protein